MEKDIRSRICQIISEMLDNPDKLGIYPTTECYDKLEEWIKEIVKDKNTIRSVE